MHDSVSNPSAASSGGPQRAAVVPAGGSRRGAVTRGGDARRGGHRVLAAAVVGLVATAGLTSCRLAGAASKADGPRNGGTLTVYISRGSSAVEHLDPQQISAATDFNISRLYSRTLTTYRSVPGRGSSQIVGDLATDTGRPSQNNQVWEFTLRNGLKWEDGKAVTCDQVKYGVERSFASVIEEGLKYPKQYLVDNDPPYPGPFLSGPNNDLKSIQCKDARTIRFQLKQPVGDFGYVVATPTFAPVRRDKDSTGDSKADYDLKPMSTGPYKIQDGSTHKKLTLIRNDFWDRATDPVRHQYPTQINVIWDNQAPRITNDLIQSQGDAQYGIALDNDVAPNFVQQVLNDPGLSARAVTGSSGAIRYFAINMKRIKDVDCRRALVYAFNKRKYLRAMGGSAFGELATTMIPLQLAAHKNFDLYNSRANPEGDVDAAQQLLKKPQCRFLQQRPLRVAYPGGPIKQYVSTLIEAYQQVGIEVQLVVPDTDSYFARGIGNKNNNYDLMYAGWIPDFPNGSGIIPPLFDSRLIPKGNSGNTNFSLMSDPAIEGLMDQAFAEADLNKQYRLWGQLDEKIAEEAPTIPVIYQSAIRMKGTKVRGAFIHAAFGQPDLVSIGLAP